MLNSLTGIRSRPARQPAIAVALAVGLGALYTWRLGSRPAGLRLSEQFSIYSSHLHQLSSYPVNAPYHLLQDLFSKMGGTTVWARLASVVFALVFLGCFYLTLKNWFGKAISLLSTLFLATTPFFILMARDATPAIMNLSLVVLLSGYLELRRRPESNWAWVFFGAGLILCVYTPGFILILLGGAIYRRREMTNMIKGRAFWQNSWFGLTLVLLISPLILSGLRHPAVVKDLFLWPGHLQGAVHTLKSIGVMGVAPFVPTSNTSELLLAHLPIFDLAQTGLALFGGYIMWARLRKNFYWILGVLVFIAASSGLNKNYNILAMMLPIISILIGMGLRYLYIEWMKVFPRNPFAKSFAILLMSTLVFAHVLYGVRYALVAWPSSASTRAHYVLKYSQ